MDMEQHDDFETILGLIQEARGRVFATVNRALVELYWQVGAFVSQKAEKDGWGKSTVEDLSTYILKKQPDIKGFTAINIWRMKRFYETYAENEKLSTVLKEIGWSHNLTIFSRCKTEEERAFYLHLTVQNRLSVRALDRQISSGAFERAMLADGDWIAMSNASTKTPPSAFCSARKKTTK